MIKLLLALYPAPWRRRYGEEFRAVLESRPLGPFDVADVLLGAIDARFALRVAETSAGDGGHIAMLRIGGFGAILGPALWFIGLAGASATEDANDAPWLVVLLIGTAGILLALAGLSAFQAHRQPRLAWAAFGIPALGTVVSMIGLVAMTVFKETPMIGEVGAWGVWMLGLVTTLVGSLLFAVASIRTAVFSERAAGALAVSSGITIAAALGTVPGVDEAAARLVVVASLAAFAGSWMALGVSALRRGPIRAPAPV